MVGGTKFPPQDSESGPWSHEQKAKSNIKSNTNTKTFHERKSQNLSRVDVSLDNADTVIDESGPWSHEQKAKSNIKSNTNTKTFHERKSQNLSPVDVSLDNADTVIEGALSF